MATILLIAITVLAACAPAAPAGQNPPAAARTTATASAPTAEPPTAVAPTAALSAASVASAGMKLTALKIVQNATLGKILADQDGRTLYTFTKDTKNTSNCYDKCAAAWPSARSDGKPTLDKGLDASLVGATPRKDGNSMLTYKGMPLHVVARNALCLHWQQARVTKQSFCPDYGDYFAKCARNDRFGKIFFYEP